jgi:PIN domain nuclease of toxin-antitoxin system
MNLLLDTHVLLWWLDDSPHLSETGRNAIADPDNLIILMIVAQAKCEGLRVVTHDTIFKKYDIPVLRV